MCREAGADCKRTCRYPSRYRRGFHHTRQSPSRSHPHSQGHSGISALIGCPNRRTRLVFFAPNFFCPNCIRTSWYINRETKMNTTIQHETPARVGTSTLNPNALNRLSTAAEDRSEKSTIDISEE